jgi:histidine triad (HIT) family protein
LEDCIFCKIINKEISSEIIYEDNNSIAFKDINPQAPVHILIIPKKHIKSLVDINKNDKVILGHLLYVAKDLASKLNISQKGFRIILNSGLESGQSVWHIHFHVIGGRKMSWPPG